MPMFSLVSLQNYLFLNFLNKKKIIYNFLGELYITLEIVFVILPACTRWFCKLNDKDAEGSSSFNSLWPLAAAAEEWALSRATCGGCVKKPQWPRHDQPLVYR